MSWREIEIVWVDTEHEWNKLGYVVDKPELEEDDFYATNVYIWRGVELGNIVDDSVSILQNISDLTEDPKVLTGFLVAVTALNLFPVYIERIQDDEHAKRFLDLMKKDQGQYYLLESELNEIPDLKYLIDHLIDLNLLVRDEEKLIIQGKVLNRVHIKNKS